MIDGLTDKFDTGGPTDCWLWTAATNQLGYGVVAVKRQARLAHRVVWEEVFGAIPEGQELHHVCEVPACVNPDHLEPVTRTEHRGKHPSYQTLKTHCPKGHPYNTANTYRYPDGRRRCRQCSRDSMRERRRRAG